uniref:Uncharacterized protein n=1 Tax=Setaria italica TaxID=4555 RepID=K3XTW1_SETIT
MFKEFQKVLKNQTPRKPHLAGLWERLLPKPCQRVRTQRNSSSSSGGAPRIPLSGTLSRRRRQKKGSRGSSSSVSHPCPRGRVGRQRRW